MSILGIVPSIFTTAINKHGRYLVINKLKLLNINESMKISPVISFIAELKNKKGIEFYNDVLNCYLEFVVKYSKEKAKDKSLLLAIFEKDFLFNIIIKEKNFFTIISEKDYKPNENVLNYFSFWVQNQKEPYKTSIFEKIVKVNDIWLMEIVKDSRFPLNNQQLEMILKNINNISNLKTLLDRVTILGEIPYDGTLNLPFLKNEEFYKDKDLVLSFIVTIKDGILKTFFEVIPENHLNKCVKNVLKNIPYKTKYISFN